MTSGPGVTNALTPVAAAWTNSAPMIVISGQARVGDIGLAAQTKSRQIGNQHLRTDLLVSSIVKRFVELTTPSASKELVSTLYLECTSNRPGPVWLSLPQDIQRGPVSENQFNFAKPRKLNYDDATLFENIFSNLKISSRPAILVGAGARCGIAEIKQFAMKFRIPILTTWPGMDLIQENDELYCGKPGSIPSTWVPNFINVETDFLIVFGARLDLGQVGYNPVTFAANAAVIRIDIDEEEFARIPARENWYNFCMNIADAKSVIRDLSLLDLELDYDQWWEMILKWKNSHPKPIEIPQDFTDGISSYKLISQVSQKFSGKNIVTGSSGTCMEMLLQSWEVNGNQRIINSCGLGSMGFAIPAAIGISAKTENGEVVCIESDGSFAMNLQDLITMKNFGAGFKVIIMDSSGYKSISLSQGRLNQFAHGNNHKTGLHLPVIEEIALAIGFETLVVERNEDIQASLEWLSNQSVPSLLVARVSPSEDALPRLISKPNSQGIMETPPMNVLTPLM